MTSIANAWNRQTTGRKAELGLAAGGLIALAVVLGGLTVGLALLVGSLGVLVAAEMPGVLFAAYLLLPIYKGALQPASPIDITVVLAALNTLGIVAIVQDHRPRQTSQAGVVLWMGLSLLILGGALYAPDQDLALDRAVRWWTLVLVPIVVGGYRVGSEPRHLRQFLWTFYGMGALTVVLGLTQLSRSERLTVFEANTIQVARAALLVPLLGVTFVLQGRYRAARLATLILIPAALVVALASGSRGPLLVLALMAFVGLLQVGWRARSINWRLVGVAGVLALAAVATVSVVAQDLPGVALERFGLLGDFVAGGLSGDASTSAGDISAGTRVTLFRLAWSMFEERPVLGFGTSGFEAVAPDSLSPAEVEAWPHNALLQAGAEFGVVGLGLILALVFLAMTRPLPHGSPGHAVRLLLVFFVLNAMVSGDIFSDRETWGLLMLVLLVNLPRAIPEAAGSEEASATRPGHARRPLATQPHILGASMSGTDG